MYHNYVIRLIKESLWKQFGASIDMLQNAIILCPEEYWTANKKFFYNAYHSVLFLDYYLTIPPKTFSSLLPFTIAASGEVTDHDIPGDVIPDRLYTKQEVLGYLQSSREKCHTLLANLTEEKLRERWIEEEGDMNYSVLEIILYNMRHIQHHAAQLNLLLRQDIHHSPGWVAQAEDEL
jgi:hypothetical protein